MEKTNAQEREALAKIQEILDDFDPEKTYVGKAFEGCVEQARANIANDERESWKSWYLDEQAKKCQLSDKLSASEEHRVELTEQLNQKDDAIARLTDANGQFSKEIDQKNAECMDLRGKVWEAEVLIGDLKQEIIGLKAKLYDLMTAGEEVSS